MAATFIATTVASGLTGNRPGEPKFRGQVVEAFEPVESVVEPVVVEAGSVVDEVSPVVDEVPSVVVVVEDGSVVDELEPVVDEVDEPVEVDDGSVVDTAVVDVVEALVVEEAAVVATVVDVVVELEVDARAVVEAVGTVAAGAVVLGEPAPSPGATTEPPSVPGNPLPVSDRAGLWGTVSATAPSWPASIREPSVIVPPDPGPHSRITPKPASMAVTAPTRTAVDQNQRWAARPASASVSRVSWTGMAGTGGGATPRPASRNEGWPGAVGAGWGDGAGSWTTVDQRRPWGGTASGAGVDRRAEVAGSSERIEATPADRGGGSGPPTGSGGRAPPRTDTVSSSEDGRSGDSGGDGWDTRAARFLAARSSSARSP